MHVINAVVTLVMCDRALACCSGNNPFLWHPRENIAHAKPEASLEPVIEVAKAAQMHDFILGLPENLERDRCHLTAKSLAFL